MVERLGFDFRWSRPFLFLLFCLTAVFAPGRTLGQEQARQSLNLPPPALWKGAVGEGFNAGTQEFGLSAGAAHGLDIFGSQQNHHLALGAVRYGWIFAEVLASKHWYRGNFELAGELFGGAQFHPDTAYLVGLTPHLRYYFATGSRWVPFADVGAGVTATDIRNGDLSTTFEFNLNAGIGTLYFLRDNLALSLESRLLHISNAGLDTPNCGVNSIAIFLGLSRWF